MNNVVAFVPIKMNNERLQGKNTKAFTNGEPLIHYILESLKEVKGIDEIYVYCSNGKIKDYLPSGVNYLKRSETLDSKDTLILEVLKAFASDIKSKYYVLAHATAPFLKGVTIQDALDHVLSGNYDSALSVSELKEFLWQSQKPMNFNINDVKKTQDLEPIYAETTGLYIYSHDLIMNKDRRTGDNPYLAKVDKIEATDINEPIDFEIADAIFKERQRSQLIQVIRENRGESYE
jgi:CMP-N-acetylneuraminic acid synthetase